MAKKQRAVVITTEWRGVFFGYVKNDLNTPIKIVLKDARNCIYWDSSIKGVLGLAATGPGKRCRIGPKVPLVTLWKITGVFDCTDKATAAWESEPWS